MKPTASFVRTLTLLVAIVGLAVVSRAGNAHANGGALEQYTVTLSHAEAEALVREGFDVVGLQSSGAKLSLELVLTPRQRMLLEARGLQPQLWRGPDGLTAKQLAARQEEEGYDVWKPYDGPDGLLAEAEAIAEAHPELVDLQHLGTSTQDRPIVALKVTRDAGETPDGTRPAVLYISLQHAREWISGEVNRRLLHHVLDSYGQDDELTALVDTRELWFVLSANPDGYQHTHDEERLWRKTLRDNDGDGEITGADGVDPNRNFDAHWGRDNEGSSSNPSSGTYRGPAPASEPETQALQGLMERVPFVFAINYHSVASLLLYDVAWQEQTPSADNPIFRALSGTPDNPAIPGFEPLLSPDLYIVNGDTCDFALEVDTLCWTPELSDQDSGGGFVFPDDEALVQAEFERVLPFSLDIARSAEAPAADLSSHLGFEVEPFYVDPFAVSFGSPQPVQVNAARYLGEVTMQYVVNDGVERAVITEEWDGGETYGRVGDVWYHRVRGEVTDVAPGDRVEVWFTAGGAESEHFTFEVEQDSDAPVLVLAAEDYTGVLPDYGDIGSPRYVDYYLDALETNGLAADVYDIDGHARTAPHPLGVLSHYDAVVWYTGDDIVTRAAGLGVGTASRLANETMLAVRDYINEGGRVLYAGKYAGYQYASQDFQYDDSARDEEADCSLPGAEGCRTMIDDFVQYYLGASSYLRSLEIPIDLENLAGTGVGWWAGEEDGADQIVQRHLELDDTVDALTLSFDSYWNIEPDYDYGYVEVSTDGGERWETVPDLAGHTTDEDPNDRSDGWALTGAGQARLRYDLMAETPITETLDIRLRYSTDRGRTLPGWWVDNFRLESGDGVLFEDDLEGEPSDWTVDGWIPVPPEPPEGEPIHPVVGAGEVFGGLSWAFGGDGAGNQDHSLSYMPMSRSYPPDEFPHLRSAAGGFYDAPGTSAHTGEHFVYSGLTARNYQRLSRTIDLSGVDEASATLWLSYDTWTPWDSVFIEARTAGEDDWTTLPDQNGNTSAQMGLRCGLARGFWFSQFPHLEHYMTVEGEGDETTCRPSGTTGEWNAAVGSSDGWQQWQVDLSAYAGESVELSVGYVRWSAEGSIGVMIDDVAFSTGESTSFEEGLGAWTVSTAEGTAPATAGHFFVATREDYPASAIVITDDTITLGFGVEGVASAEDRAAVMGRAMDYLLRDRVPVTPAIYLPLAYRKWDGG